MSLLSSTAIILPETKDVFIPVTLLAGQTIEMGIESWSDTSDDLVRDVKYIDGVLHIGPMRNPHAS